MVFQKALNAKRCPVSRYQPFAYWTNSENRCIYQKSNCTAEGQHLLSNSGTTTTDSTCRCDYRKGYSYLMRPEDPCNCKPNEEDCSCYLKFCNDDQVLSPGTQISKYLKHIMLKKCALVAIIPYVFRYSIILGTLICAFLMESTSDTQCYVTCYLHFLLSSNRSGNFLG